VKKSYRKGYSCSTICETHAHCDEKKEKNRHYGGPLPLGKLNREGKSALAFSIKDRMLIIAGEKDCIMGK